MQLHLIRDRATEIPIDAVREALINSFCHKDYGACQTNEVAIYKDRVEIYNPGKFPEGYKPEDFISGNERPIRRNPLIASILYYSKDVESFGTGLKRISDACAEASCRVEFHVIKSGFVTTFYRDESLGDAASGTATGTDHHDTVQVAVHDTVQVIGQVTVQELLSYCRTPRSRQEIQDFCHLAGRNSFSKLYLKPLLDSGLLVMTVPDKPKSKNQKYVAVKENAGNS